jgi:hypothetical protein
MTWLRACKEIFFKPRGGQKPGVRMPAMVWQYRPGATGSLPDIGSANKWLTMFDAWRI